jgi:Zn-dependent protease
MEHYWHLGRWRGIPVSLHWTVLLAYPWLYLWFRDFLAALIGTGVFVLLLIAHEFGHVWLARWRRVPIESITLYGWHGETSLGLVRSRGEEVLIAWGGVAVQFAILIAAFAVSPLLTNVESPLAWTFLGPTFAVLTQWNIFLILVALLPIGPMDGHAAWGVFKLMRSKWKKRRTLSPQKRKQLQEQSEKIAAEVIRNLGKNRAGRK